MFEMVSRNTAKKLNGGSGEITKPPRIVQENNNVLDRRSEDEAILSNPMLKVEVVFAKRIRNLEKRKVSHRSSVLDPVLLAAGPCRRRLITGEIRFYC